MRQKITQQLRHRQSLGITLAVTLGMTTAVLALQATGILQLLEWAALDQWFRWRPLDSLPSRVVIVTVDEADISRLGQWPISDADLARLLTTLKQYKPRAIGLDLYRNLPVEPGHQALRQVFATTPNLIGIEKTVNDASGPVVAGPPILRDRDQVAASDLVIDDDGKVRRNLLSIGDRPTPILTLGAKLALIALQADQISPQQQDSQLHLGKATFTALQPYEGGYVDVDIGGYQTLANYYRAQTGILSISLSDVLANRIAPEICRDRIVLIGSIAESLSDRFYTPYTSSVHTTWAGVEIHANIANQLLSAALDGRPSLRGIPEPAEWTWIFLWATIGSTLGWRLTTLRTTLPILVIFGSSLFSVTYLSFLGGWWLPLISPLLACGGAGIIRRACLLWANLRSAHRDLATYAQTLESKIQERTQQLLNQTLSLEQARQAAEAANQAKSSFLANMNHELRTPLTVILGFTDLLARDRNLTPIQKERLTTVSRSGEHLLSLINSVLDLAKIEAGALPLSITAVNLPHFLTALEDMFHLQVAQKHITLTVTVAANLPPLIQTDEGKLRQILINLLSNAIKFTEQGHITLDVRQATAPDHADISAMDTPYLWFEIADTGPGIPAHELARIFDAFMQTETGRNTHQGTGLGLAITRQFVQLLGGTLTVQSTLGQGSQFTFTLPLRSGFITPVPPLPTSWAPGIPPCLDLPDPAPRILIVEDVAENRLFWVDCISQAGFEVVAVDNGAAAIAQWQAWSPQLILMDLRMPILDGYQAIQHIRTLEANAPASPRTKIIALTASPFHTTPTPLLASGCDDILYKPCRESLLITKIAHHLNIPYLDISAPAPSPPPVGDPAPWSPMPAAPPQLVLQPPLSLGEAIARHTTAAPLPATWITDLHTAAQRLNADRCFNLIEQIPKEYDNLANRLTTLVHNFEFDAVIDIIQALPRSDSPGRNPPS
jgi:adenylate cyclase